MKATTLWHFDAAERAPSTTSKASFPGQPGDVGSSSDNDTNGASFDLPVGTQEVSAHAGDWCVVLKSSLHYAYFDGTGAKP